MLASKHITVFVAALMAAVTVLCLCAGAFSDVLTDSLGGAGVAMEYEAELFSTDSIISLNIVMEESKWQEMLDNAIAEEYYQCDITVNGKTFYSVGIRPKGNTSLSAIASDPDTDRYSFKLEFDYYVDGQTCFGLDKLVLNNNYADATNMKEAIIYDMYRSLGADASLYNYAKISVNGDYFGVYLALEAVEDSFLLRCFGTEAGELYKPDSMDIGGGMGGGKADFNVSDRQGGNFTPDNLPEGFDINSVPEGFGGGKPNGAGNADSAGSVNGAGNAVGAGNDIGAGNAEPDGEIPKVPVFDMPNAGGGFRMGGGGGANLEYTDDELDSYSTIWEGSVTKTSESDHRRVVTALKNISEGNELEKYLDVDNVLRYMAVHVFSVNADSLSGSMAHNYYLYEHDGRLNILPWDYNLSFGGMAQGGVSGASDIVNDAIDTPFDGTDFFNVLLENEEYLARYHEYLELLCEKYGDGGGADELYSRIRSQLDGLVKTDPTAFYSYDEYNAGAEMLYKTVTLRIESIKGQLDGSIPSTDAAQKEAPSALVDASDINISVMGTMNGGKMENGRGENNSEQNKNSELEKIPASSEAVETDGSTKDGRRRTGEAFGMPNGGGFNVNGASGAAAVTAGGNQNLILYPVCFAILAAALLFAALFRRRSRKL